MSDTYPSVGQTDNLEHTDENHAKKVNTYVWNSGSGVWERMSQPGGSSSSGKATDAYSYTAKSDDGTYTYYYFEDASGNYYIRRKAQATNVHTFTAGTGGYATVYTSAIAGPSGSPTWATYAGTF